MPSLPSRSASKYSFPISLTSVGVLIFSVLTRYHGHTYENCSHVLLLRPPAICQNRYRIPCGLSTYLHISPTSRLLLRNSRCARRTRPKSIVKAQMALSKAVALDVPDESLHIPSLPSSVRPPGRFIGQGQSRLEPNVARLSLSSIPAGGLQAILWPFSSTALTRNTRLSLAG